MLGTKTEVIIIVLTQYIPRFLRIFPLMTELKRSSGVVAESAWMGAVYYLLWYLLASHVSYPLDHLTFSILIVYGVSIN